MTWLRRFWRHIGLEGVLEDPEVSSEKKRAANASQIEALAQLLVAAGLVGDEYFRLKNRYQKLEFLWRVIGETKKKKEGEEGARLLLGVDFEDRFGEVLEQMNLLPGQKQAVEQAVRIMLGGMQGRLDKQIRGYEPVEIKDKKREGLVALMTATVQAFLARSAQGLCTDQDVSRYAQDDNWHMLVVDEQQKRVVGMAMCYDMGERVVDEEGKTQRGMMMRQLNARELLDQGVAAKSVVREMIKAAVGFMRANGMTYLVLSVNDAWHVLGNDRRIVAVLNQYFGKEEKKTKLERDFSVASDKRVRRVYVIPLEGVEEILAELE